MNKSSFVKGKWIDNPLVGEIYADAMPFASYDGNNMRLEFTASRLRPEGKDTVAVHYPVCRLTIPLKTFVVMLARLNDMGKKLEEKGKITLKTIEELTPTQQ